MAFRVEVQISPTDPWVMKPAGMSATLLESMMAERQVRRVQELREAGVHQRTIRAALDGGAVERPVFVRSLGPVPGILVSAEAACDPDLADAVAMVVAGSGDPVIWRRTAAMRLGLGTGLARRIDVETDHSYTKPPPQANICLYRRRDVARHGDGVDERMTDLGVAVRMTTPARTVVDLFECGLSGVEDSDDYRHALAALASYAAAENEPAEIFRLARGLNAQAFAKVEAAVHMAYESLSQGCAP